MFMSAGPIPGNIYFSREWAESIQTSANRAPAQPQGANEQPAQSGAAELDFEHMSPQEKMKHFDEYQKWFENRYKANTAYTDANNDPMC